MNIIDVVVPAFFIVLIIKQIRSIKTLMVKPHNGFIDIIVLILCLIIFLVITYKCANSVRHYITGILACILIITMFFNVGISSKGFVSRTRGEELVPWDKIQKVVISSKKYIEVTFSGNCLGGTLKFNKNHHSLIMKVIKEHVHIEKIEEVM